jgi:hypothetical protein
MVSATLWEKPEEIGEGLQNNAWRHFGRCPQKNEDPLADFFSQPIGIKDPQSAYWPPCLHINQAFSVQFHKSAAVLFGSTRIDDVTKQN